MFSLIPWDVKCAGILLVVTVLASVFGPSQIIFIGLYAMLCAYIIVSTFCGEGKNGS
jgi:hypothetical protein